MFQYLNSLTNQIWEENDKFKLTDDLYSVSDIQDYFEYILKKHGENINKPSVKIFVNKIESIITFKVIKWIQS